jgi:NAD(P)-dependent dehydrogenase (short-subunit alcohol dehydrogenase family)
MSEKNMENKVIMITGATSGIGEVTARELARMGALVVGVGRNPEKCGLVEQAVRQETGNPEVNFLVADLSSQSEIYRLVGEFKQRFSRLDVLVNNAGAVFFKRIESVDGLEMTFALNHMSYFLLTGLLLDTLKASAPARIVNVSSGAHVNAKLDLDDLQFQKSYNGWKAYSRSKFANILFTYELARRLNGSGVSVNALHPGFVATGLAKNNSWLVRVGVKIAQTAARSPEEGARTMIYLASSNDVEGVSGRYYQDLHPEKSAPSTYDVSLAQRLWEISEGLIILKD